MGAALPKVLSRRSKPDNDFEKAELLSGHVIGADDIVEKGVVSCTSSGYVSTVSTPLRTSQTLSASSTDSQDLVDMDVGSGSFPSPVMSTTTESAIAPAPSAHDNESNLLRIRSCTPSSVLIDVKDRKFVYLSKTIDKANFWIKDQKRPSIDIPNKTVIVNGMVKTGKTTFVRNVLPHLIHPHFPNADFWFLDCDRFDSGSPDLFLGSALSKVHEYLAEANVPLPYVSDVLKQISPAEHFYVQLRSCVEAASRRKHVFIVMDEVQRWFTWAKAPKKEELDDVAICRMRRRFKHLIFNPDAPNAHFIVTGSAMGAAWAHLYECTTNGNPLIAAFRINLPYRVSRDIIDAEKDVLNAQGLLSLSILNRMSYFCDSNHAMLSFLAERGNSCNVEDDATSVATICSRLISTKLAEEIWHDTACALHMMWPAMRLALRKLVSPLGLEEEELCNMRGWRVHLAEFWEEVSDAEVEGKRYCVKSGPFQSFILHFILPDGELRYKIGAPVANLEEEVRFCRYAVGAIAFGEACNVVRKNPQHPKLSVFVRNGLNHLEQQLKAKGMSNPLFQGSKFCQLLLKNEDSKYKSLSKAFASPRLLDSLSASLIAQSHFFAYHLLLKRAELLEVMKNCPFDFWDALPHITLP